MIQSLTLTPRTDELGLEPVWRSSPFVIEAPVLSGHSSAAYRAHIWRNRADARIDAAEPLATAYGTVASGTVSLAFTGAQMALDLTAGDGDYDDFWLSIIALQNDGQVIQARGGWFTVIDGGFDPETAIPVVVVFTVVNDKALFEYEGVTYYFQVEQIEAVPGAPDGSVEVVDDVLRFISGEIRWGVQVEATSTPPNSDEGEVQVIADRAIITLSAQSFTWQVARL